MYFINPTCPILKAISPYQPAVFPSFHSFRSLRPPPANFVVKNEENGIEKMRKGEWDLAVCPLPNCFSGVPVSASRPSGRPFLHFFHVFEWFYLHLHISFNVHSPIPSHSSVPHTFPPHLTLLSALEISKIGAEGAEIDGRQWAHWTGESPPHHQMARLHLFILRGTNGKWKERLNGVGGCHIGKYQKKSVVGLSLQANSFSIKWLPVEYPPVNILKPICPSIFDIATFLYIFTYSNIFL